MPVRLGGEQRWIDAADAGLYRDALGVVPPGGLPEAFLEDVPDALLRVGALRAPPTGRSRATRCGRATGSTSAPRSGARARRRARARRAAARRHEREWCDPEVLRRLRRASLAALRKEVEPVDQRALARFLPGWQGVDRHPATGAGIDRLREVLVPLQGLALPAEVWERDVLPRRTGAYSPAWMDQLCAAGEVVWIGAGALGRNSGRVALYFREDLRAARRRRPFDGGEPPAATPAHERVRARLRDGACFFTDLLAESTLPRRGDAGGAVGSGLGRRGDQRRVRAAARAAADAGAGPAGAAARAAPAGGRGRVPAARRGAGPLRPAPRSRAAGR